MFIYAHRGSSGYAPENTMAAFQMAVDMNCPGIELDVQLTKDGHVVICHDEDVSRTTNGQGFIKDFTLEELRALDAGSWMDPKFHQEKIPTLVELLDLVKNTEMIMNFEIKNLPFYYVGIEQKLADAIKEAGMEDQAIISSFDHYALQTIHKICPELKLGLLFSTRIIDPWIYAQQLPYPVYSLNPDWSFVDSHYVQQSHLHGYQVLAYTVNERPTYEALRDIGVHGIFSNYPDQFM
ncbi:glycerophosphodiester phosphodiesterase [Paenibacillus sp. N1-5-1-14]|uniref:glycerophosphodiester phosphodiesterase n=1 Tax=Paenibacillus radicibacter TaxID=2972488 RepID=UPI002158CC0D|nr:glycerophosphodiester phosphodiesterase [Paenibacillus radicibacter]MCR8644046.1 glycerophosphodiester phosphodiesterase [Paenibacillus radicibacter]